MVSLAEQLSNACKAFAQAVITDTFVSSKANLHSTTGTHTLFNICLISMTKMGEYPMLSL